MKATFLFVLLLSSYSFAHLCHDPFRSTGHLLLVPEKDNISIEEKGEFRIFVENPFQSILKHLRLIVESEAFEVEVQPLVLKDLAPGEKTYFLVKLRLRRGFKPGNYPLRISISAKSAEITPSIERIDVVAEEKSKEEPKKQPLPPPIESYQEPEKPQEETCQEKIIEELPDEIPDETGEITIKVEKIPFYKKSYFYLFFILLLLGILIWRKIK